MHCPGGDSASFKKSCVVLAGTAQVLRNHALSWRGQRKFSKIMHCPGGDSVSFKKSCIVLAGDSASVSKIPSCRRRQQSKFLGSVAGARQVFNHGLLRPRKRISGEIFEIL
jgi:hypothetical protein